MLYFNFQIKNNILFHLKLNLFSKRLNITKRLRCNLQDPSPFCLGYGTEIRRIIPK